MRSATGALRILDDKTQACLGQLEAARAAIISGDLTVHDYRTDDSCPVN